MIEILNVSKHLAEEMNDREMYQESVTIGQQQYHNMEKTTPLNPIQ